MRVPRPNGLNMSRRWSAHGLIPIARQNGHENSGAKSHWAPGFAGNFEVAVYFFKLLSPDRAEHLGLMNLTVRSKQGESFD